MAKIKPLTRAKALHPNSGRHRGLNLNITKAIAKRHGGCLYFNNGPESGVTANVNLPLIFGTVNGFNADYIF